jgi:hypothetical protein
MEQNWLYYKSENGRLEKYSLRFANFHIIEIIREYINHGTVDEWRIEINGHHVRGCYPLTEAQEFALAELKRSIHEAARLLRKPRYPNGRYNS